MGVITDRKPVTTKSIAELIDAMAYAVDVLVWTADPLPETRKAIIKLLACDVRIWDELDPPTVEILERELKMKKPQRSDENGGS